MLSPVDTGKRLLHRDICADPVLHGLVLNLYLNGERYPHRVEGYFSIPGAEEPALAELMRAHLRDEDKHIVMYRKAIARLGQPVLELPLADIFNHVICAHTPSRAEPSCREATRRAASANGWAISSRTCIFSSGEWHARSSTTPKRAPSPPATMPRRWSGWCWETSSAMPPTPARQ